jgi:hypothetical protein
VRLDVVMRTVPVTLPVFGSTRIIPALSVTHRLAAPYTTVASDAAGKDRSVAVLSLARSIRMRELPVVAHVASSPVATP